MRHLFRLSWGGTALVVDSPNRPGSGDEEPPPGTTSGATEAEINAENLAGVTSRRQGSFFLMRNFWQGDPNSDALLPRPEKAEPVTVNDAPVQPSGQYDEDSKRKPFSTGPIAIGRPGRYWVRSAYDTQPDSEAPPKYTCDWLYMHPPEKGNEIKGKVPFIITDDARINDSNVIICEDRLWRNGAGHKMTDLVDETKYTKYRLHCINDSATIGAQAFNPATGGWDPVILYPVEFTYAGEILAGKELEAISQWTPNNGIGSGQLVAGVPYGNVSVSLTGSTATLSAFDQIYPLSRISSILYRNASNTVSVKLDSARSSDQSSEEILSVQITAPAINLNNTPYLMRETGATTSNFAASFSAFSVTIPTLSTTLADSVKLTYIENGVFQELNYNETGANTKLFNNTNSTIELLGNPASPNTLFIRLALSGLSSNGGVYKLQYRNDAWHTNQPMSRTNTVPLAVPERVAWNCTIKGFHHANFTSIPIEIIEEHREYPNVSWSAQSIGQGNLESSASGFTSPKPIAILSSNSNIMDASAADRSNHNFLIAGNATPSVKGARVQTRYRIKFNSDSIKPAGTLVSTKPALREAIVMRSLEASVATGQSLNEKRNIAEPIEELGYEVSVETGTLGENLNGVEDRWLENKSIIYLMAHGGGTGHSGPLLPITPSITPGSDLGAIMLQAEFSKFWPLRAGNILTNKAINPELALMATCFSAMTEVDRSSVPGTDIFYPGSEAFAQAFGGAYVGYAWMGSPKTVHSLMSRYVAELKGAKSFRIAFNRYLAMNPGDDARFLKMYKRTDLDFTPNDVKPGTVPTSGEE